MLNQKVNVFGRNISLWILLLAGLLFIVLVRNPSLPEWAAYLIIIFVSFPVHEIAHAYMADYYGDMTPRTFGRITLNPLAHIDWLGAFLLFMFGFGWAKPVPVNELELTRRNPRAPLFVALAGPMSNLGLAIFGGLLTRAGTFFGVNLLFGGFITDVLTIFVLINLFLMFFNLIPLFPLDGEKVLLNLLPHEMRQPLLQLRRYQMMPLLILLMLSTRTGLFEWIIIRPSWWLAELLIG